MHVSGPALLISGNTTSQLTLTPATARAAVVLLVCLSRAASQSPSKASTGLAVSCPALCTWRQTLASARPTSARYLLGSQKLLRFRSVAVCGARFPCSLDACLLHLAQPGMYALLPCSNAVAQQWQFALWQRNASAVAQQAATGQSSCMQRRQHYSTSFVPGSEARDSYCGSSRPADWPSSTAQKDSGVAVKGRSPPGTDSAKLGTSCITGAPVRRYMLGLHGTRTCQILARPDHIRLCIGGGGHKRAGQLSSSSSSSSSAPDQPCACDREAKLRPGCQRLPAGVGGVAATVQGHLHACGRQASGTCCLAAGGNAALCIALITLLA